MNTARKISFVPIGILRMEINYCLSSGYYVVTEGNEAGKCVGKISSY
jgi:hypothetical protein